FARIGRKTNRAEFTLGGEINHLSQRRFVNRLVFEKWRDDDRHDAFKPFFRCPHSRLALSKELTSVTSRAGPAHSQKRGSQNQYRDARDQPPQRTGRRSRPFAREQATDQSREDEEGVPQRPAERRPEPPHQISAPSV